MEDTFDQMQEERLWPTVDEDLPTDGMEDWRDDGDEPEGSYDLTDDGDALASAGMGTDEDYGDFGGEDDYLDGSYEE